MLSLVGRVEMKFIRNNSIGNKEDLFKVKSELVTGYYVVVIISGYGYTDSSKFTRIKFIIKEI